MTLKITNSEMRFLLELLLFAIKEFSANKADEASRVHDNLAIAILDEMRIAAETRLIKRQSEYRITFPPAWCMAFYTSFNYVDKPKEIDKIHGYNLIRKVCDTINKHYA